MLPLFLHQSDLLNAARQSLKLNAATIVQLGTGGGKTHLGSTFARLCVDKGKRVVFSVHRDFLVDQTAAAFRKVGLDFGLIASGLSPDPTAPAQIASIDTLRHRLDQVRGCDLLIIDECHHVLAPSWLSVVRHFMSKGAKVLGLTATPWRMSGAALGTVFTDMVCGPSIRWMIDNNYLSPYRAFAPAQPDLRGVHTRAGDYVQSEIADVMDKPTLVGDAVATYKRLANGGRALAFCVSVVHSEHVAAQFNAAGIVARHLDGNTPKDVRRRTIESFKRGDIQVLSSVEIFGEGFDSPAVDAVILLRPTQSLGLHLQQIGRGLRTAPGKERVTIADHAGNLLRLGLPDDDFQWSLEGGAPKKRDGKDKPAAVRQCSACFCCHKPAPTCPECGFVYQIEGRKVKEVAGDLVELSSIERHRERTERSEELKRAKTLSDYEALARKWGYNRGWAYHRWTARKKILERFKRTA